MKFSLTTDNTDITDMKVKTFNHERHEIIEIKDCSAGECHSPLHNRMVGEVLRKPLLTHCMSSRGTFIRSKLRFAQIKDMKV